LILQPASDNARFMRPMIVKMFPTPNLEYSVRAQGLWLGFNQQFTHCRQEAADSLPVLKP